MARRTEPRRDVDDVAAAIADGCVALRLRIVTRAVNAIYDEALRGLGSTIGQLNLLVALSRMGEASPTRLGRALRLELSTLSRNLERMRARGWIESVPSHDRAQRLRLTAAGRKLLVDAYPAWQQAQRDARALLGQATASAIGRASAKLRAAADRTS
ncbi:MAG: MarR family winged helix-turn-helix transcriptional regulator [Thermodesulfobacteriota bacterium]